MEEPQMDIGREIRTITIEPLWSPVPHEAPITAPEPVVPEPVPVPA